MTRPPRVESVVDYLRANGWEITGQWRDANVWSWTEFDVLVPPDGRFADTTARLRELAACVADAEGRSLRAVWRDMASPTADVVSYRASVDDGSVSLQAGTGAVRAVGELVVVCARDALGEVGLTRDGVPDEVRALLEHSRLSMSDDDRFGLDVLLRVAADDPDPLGRKTALGILHTSTVVLEAARSADSDAFDRIADLGVSDAACGALADLVGDDQHSALELKFRWSPLRPRPSETLEFPSGVGARIRSRRGRAPKIDGGVARLPEQVAGSVEGLVIGLSDEPAGDRWRIKVRAAPELEGLPPERPRLVNVGLGSAADYETAFAAHRDGHSVRVRGTLVTTGRTWSITVPTSFNVID